jgi:NAD(P)-dependent dehydrogenase (short-subunit alcohol dehydrogenase family)
MSALSIEKLFGVKGYVALVTGGSSGLGLMICKVWEHSPFQYTVGALTKQ